MFPHMYKVKLRSTPRQTKPKMAAEKAEWQNEASRRQTNYSPPGFDWDNIEDPDEKPSAPEEPPQEDDSRRNSLYSRDSLKHVSPKKTTRKRPTRRESSPDEFSKPHSFNYDEIGELADDDSAAPWPPEDDFANHNGFDAADIEADAEYDNDDPSKPSWMPQLKKVEKSGPQAPPSPPPMNEVPGMHLLKKAETGPPPPPPPPPKKDVPGMHLLKKAEPGAPPPPPPPPPDAPGMHLLRKPTEEDIEKRQKKIDGIKKRARGRPDWQAMIKQIEGGASLRHVPVAEKNDRSCPLLPDSRGKGGKEADDDEGHFVYESEKPIQGNQLLSEIRTGVQLRKVKTNDRSRPDFLKLGMTKLRRQVTVDEKDKENPEPLPISSDEEEDIDRMRDDIQATKTQLQDEIKNKKKLEREKKILKIDVDSLKTEVKKLKRQLKEHGAEEDVKPVNGETILPALEKSMSKLRMRDEEELDFSELDNIDKEVGNLKLQAEQWQKKAEDMERKYNEANEKLDVTQKDLEDMESRATLYERKYKHLQKERGIELPDIECVCTQTDPMELGWPQDMPYNEPKKTKSRGSFSAQFGRMNSVIELDYDASDSSSESEEEEEEEIEEDEEELEMNLDDMDNDAAAAKRAEIETKRQSREVKHWRNKLDHMTDKEGHVRKERNNLRQRISKYHNDIVKERETYHKLKGEIKEMASSLKELEDVAAEDGFSESDSCDEEDCESNSDGEDGFWFDDPDPEGNCKKRRKPKPYGKIKRRTVQRQDTVWDEEEEEEPEVEIIEPEWSESEEEEEPNIDEIDNDDVPYEERVSKLEEMTENHEQRMNQYKKTNYHLKAEAEKWDELFQQERYKCRRLEEEINLMVSELG